MKSHIKAIYTRLLSEMSPAAIIERVAYDLAFYCDRKDKRYWRAPYVPYTSYYINLYASEYINHKLIKEFRDGDSVTQ